MGHTSTILEREDVSVPDSGESTSLICLSHVYLQRLERRELELAEQLRDIKERYVSLEVSVSRILERLHMEDAEKEDRKLKRSSSFYGVFGL